VAVPPALAAVHPATPTVAHHDASIGSTISHFFDSARTFFSQLAHLSWVPLLIGLAA
jgi:uncharacterized membrane protein YbhN (UPF0104 family)